ncbi:MAG: hypothetical protein FWG16_00455 [Micrococcales bacterium]|nr:hypothetical protein [Micrococcales bacterium]
MPTSPAAATGNSVHETTPVAGPTPTQELGQVTLWRTSVEGVDVTMNALATESLAQALSQAVTYPDGEAFSYDLDSPLDLEIRQAVINQLVLAEPSLQDAEIGIDQVEGFPGMIGLLWAFGCPPDSVCDIALSSTSLAVAIIKETPDSPENILVIGPPEGGAWVFLDQ